MHSRPIAAALAAALLAGLAPITTLAASRSAYVITAADCGGTVTQNAVLLTNIDCGTGGTITAGADISISLGGHTITGASGHDVIDTESHNVTISGGKLVVGDGGYSGVNMYLGTVRVSGMTITSASSAKGTGYGIYQNGGTLTVSSSTMSGLYDGINSSSGVLAVSSTTVTRNLDDGILVYQDSSVTLTNVTATYNVSTGIEIGRSELATITKSVADHNGFQGISVVGEGAGTVGVSGSYARNNGDAGIVLRSAYDNDAPTRASSVSSTVASWNGNDGFVISNSGFLTLTGNTATGNAAYGFHLLLVNTGIVTATNNLAKANVAGGYASEDAAVGGTGNVATGNGTPQCISWTCTIR